MPSDSRSKVKELLKQHHAGGVRHFNTRKGGFSVKVLGANKKLHGELSKMAHKVDKVHSYAGGHIGRGRGYNNTYHIKSGQDTKLLGGQGKPGGHAGRGQPSTAGTDRSPVSRQDPATKVPVRSAATNARGR